jgi:hypothetical protein
MPCKNHREALSEAAAGGAALSHELRAHLGACTGCSEFFGEESKLFAAIDTGVSARVNREIPASFLPKVSTALGDADATQNPWSFPWLIPIAASLLLAIAFGQIWRWHEKRLEGARVVSPAPAVAVGPSRSPETWSAPDRQASIAPRNSARGPVVTALQLKKPELPTRQEPEVLIPAQEEAAVRTYVAALHEQRHRMRLGTGEQTATLQPAPSDIAPVAFADLEIKPLNQTDEERNR